MIRHHANILLTNYWRTLVAPSAAVFRALFLNAGVSDAVLDAWHSQLVKGGDVKHVQWVASYRRDLARMPRWSFRAETQTTSRR